MKPRRRPAAPALPPATVDAGLPALHSAQFVAAVDAAVTAQSSPHRAGHPVDDVVAAYTGRTVEHRAEAAAAGAAPTEADLAVAFHASARERLHRADDPAGTAGASPDRVTARWTAFRAPYGTERTA